MLLCSWASLEPAPGVARVPITLDLQLILLQFPARSDFTQRLWFLNTHTHKMQKAREQRRALAAVIDEYFIYGAVFPQGAMAAA